MSSHSTKISLCSNKNGYFARIFYIQKGSKSELVRAKSIKNILELDKRIRKLVSLLTISL